MRYEYSSAIRVKNPRGGWWMEDDGYILRADSHEDLVQKLISFREQRGLSTGDPEQDVRQAIIRRNPKLGRLVHGEEEQDAPSKPRKATLEAVSSWLHDITSKEYKRVFPDTHERRLDACLHCKYNNTKDLPENTFGGKGYEYTLFTATKGKIDKGLGICDLYKHDNRLAVWIDGYKRVRQEDKPNECWVEDEHKTS